MDHVAFPTATVIIVGFNSRRLLARCLTAVLGQDYPGDFEVIFVDNASDDGSVDLVRRQFPTVRVIESNRNLGYAGGNNLGSAYARGAVLAFLNPDTEAAPTWLRELVRPLVDDRTVGITTSKIVLAARPESINAGGNDISLSGITTCRSIGIPASALTTDEEVSAASGAAMAIHAALFDVLAGFDEDFWMYLEDADLSWRARIYGYRCVLATQSIVRHEYRFSLSPAKTRLLERNRYRMLAKNLSGPAHLVLLPVLVANELLTWAWALLQGRAYVAAKFLAIRDAWASVPQVRQRRRIVQSTRQRPDADILRQHAPSPAVEQISGGMASRFAIMLICPFVVVAANVGLALLRLGETSPAANRPKTTARANASLLGYGEDN